MSFDVRAADRVDLPAEVLVGIDTTLWEPSSRIRWPDAKDRRVHVHFTAADAAAALGLSEGQEQELLSQPHGIWMGQHGNRLAVMFQAEVLVTDPKVRRFVTEHEAFHLAAQYYGARVGLKRLGARTAGHPKEVDEFWRAILRSTSEGAAPPSSATCRELGSRFGSLQPDDRLYVLHRAFWEWPAEYYSRARVFGLNDDAEYLGFRHELSPGENLYFAGGVAMAMVARVHGEDRGWQRRIEQGDNPLNVVMETMGCASFDDDGGVGTVSRVNFIDPG